VEGIWVTHYHDDHTNFVQTASEELHAPVFSSPEMKDILEHPSAYKMPCLTANPIRQVTVAPDGGSRRWHEFQFTYSYYPGQTLYHDGLLVKKDGAESVFFIGDSFTPSGIDDYCVLNRNFVEPEKGYEYCLNYIKRAKPDWLVNEHVNPAFHYSDAQIDTMLANVRKRKTQLAALVPWDDANFGVDEQWARFYPYRSEAKSGDRVELKVMIQNHSPETREFVVKPHVPDGWRVSGPFKIAVASRKSGELVIPIGVGSAGLGVVTADVSFDKWQLQEWVEALVEVK
jgi:glyoxylase-like metal-dependent hydrolase (beta-lactamase superfamily II)